MKKKHIILIIVVAIVLALGGIGAFFGIRAYNDYLTQQQTTEKTQAIENVYIKFEVETDRDKKLKILSDFVNCKDSTYDEVSEAVSGVVMPHYLETMEKMRQYFIDEYNEMLAENTLSEIEKMEDTEKLTTAISNLSELSETITNEIGIVCSQEQAEEYINTINELTKSYEARIEEIELAEEEKKKAEEEAKKKAEEEAQKVTEAQQSDYSSDNNSNSSNSNNSSGSTWTVDSSNYDKPGFIFPSGVYDGERTPAGCGPTTSWYYSYHDDGTIYQVSYSDDYGNAWDTNGNVWDYYEVRESFGMTYYTYPVYN